MRSLILAIALLASAGTAGVLGPMFDGGEFPVAASDTSPSPFDGWTPVSELP